MQEAPNGPVRRLDVPAYGSGGSEFSADAGAGRYVVRLLAMGDGMLRRGARSALRDEIATAVTVRHGICTAATGDHRAGWVVGPRTAVRSVPRADAAPVADTAALPFVWSSPDADPTRAPGWVAMRLWRPDGGHADGFVRPGTVRFAG